MKSESRLTFLEATSIIVGHGVGSGVLAVPFLASRNSWGSFLLILLVGYLVNLLLHFMIAELSWNNEGAQFIKCFENELFQGKLKKPATWTAFAILGFSVLVNVSGFITGSAAVFSSWFGVPAWLGMLLYYIAAGSIVFFGMKVVGIAEKISVFSMVGVIGILFGATLLQGTNPLPSRFIAPTNVLALYSMVSFALSAVMSVPQVVKGLDGDGRRIKSAIALGTGINILLVFFVTLMTLLGVGSAVSQNGALVDLSGKLGGWVSIIGFVFSLLALSTSFWANTLNLRDIIHEQTKLPTKVSYLVATLPCLLLALTGLQGFVGFTRLAGIVQVLTGIGIIVAYNRSRRKNSGSSPICGKWGTLPFQLLVILGSLLATIGSVLAVK